MRKMLSFGLALIFAIGMNVRALNSELNNPSLLSQSMNEFDIVLAAAVKLNSDNYEDDILYTGSTVRNIIPLYDDKESIVAFYVSFNPTGYAVVNNNKLNLAVIEYGRGTKFEIEKIVNHNKKAIYNNPISIYTHKYVKKRENSGKNFYDFYPELLQSDIELQEEISAIKSKVSENNIATKGDGDYGFVDWGDMPSAAYSAKTIMSAYSTSWITTYDTAHIAHEHCGATAATNIALYYASCGYSNLKINNSKIDTFKAVHKIIGNGPTMMIAGGTEKYFHNRGYSLSSASVYDFDAVKNAAYNDQIQGVLLADGIDNWHWVLAVGYRQYNSGENYMRIVNGWDNSIDVFYKVNSGSAWISATRYWVD